MNETKLKNFLYEWLKPDDENALESFNQRLDEVFE